MVVDDHLNYGNIVPCGGGDFIHIHAEASVSGDIEHQLISVAHLGSYGCAQAIAHGSQAA